MKLFKYISAFAIIAAVFAGTAALNASAENNSVSGYVSLTKGHKIVGYETSLYLQYGTKEDKSVVRAIGDLADDIKAVTGKKIGMAANDDFLYGALPPHGIVYDLYGPMCVFTYDAVPADSVCYVAAYNSDGSLNAVAQASKAYYTDDDGDTNIFEFEEALERPAWGSMKAFVWDNNMKPIIDEQLDIEERSSALFIGTLGAGGLVDDYFAQRNEAIASLKDKRESFTIQEVNGQLVIAGSDKRGTIYGIYDLCEKMGVSSWKFWADVEPEKAEELYINLPENGYTEGEPSVEYRGIFLNDEYNLNQWTNEDFASNMNNTKYEKIYELLLRLKMNTLWPAMHKYSTPFHNIQGAAEKADEYGIVMGSSHAEPLLRNNLGELLDFYNEWKEKEENKDKPLYLIYDKDDIGANVPYVWTHYSQYENGVGVEGTEVYNCEFLEDYWRESVKANGQYDNIYTLGMRGVHDGSFSTNMNYETALKELIAVQLKILEEELVGEGKKYSKIEDVPTVFIPYKDVLTYYNKPDRLNLPEYVTIMWTDDNYGYMRQNANEAERQYSGGGGVYYHVSYYGWPTSYLWISSTQPGLIREQLTRSYDMGSDKMWILNVGDLKPAEKEIEYYARLSRDIEGMNKTDISDVYTQMAKRDFNMSDTDAKEYADIMDTYYELANSKRPEFYRTNDANNKLNISVTAYGDEGERYIERYKDITERAEKLYNALPDDKKPSFYELALYPIRSAKNMAVDFVQASHATLYNEQGRYGAVNALSAEANAAAKQIEDDTNTYNTMLDGKWNKMMVINPAHFTSCDAKLTTELNPPTVTELDFTDIGIAVNGEEYDSAQTIKLSQYDSGYNYIDIYNKGYGSFDYEISNGSGYIEEEKFQNRFECVKFSKKSGTVYGSERIYFRLDKDAEMPVGDYGLAVAITALIDGKIVKYKDINITLSNPEIPSNEKMYVETNGTVSVEAEHYTRLTDNGVYKWQIEKDFARSGDSLKIYPNLSDDVTNTADEMLDKSAVAEYDIYFENAGTYNVNIYRMPTLNERGTCRVGIGLDDGNPISIGGTNAYPSTSSATRTKTNAWPNNVLKNHEVLKTTVTVNEAGKHTLKMYNISSGMVIDKIVLVKGDVPYSYFGAPESYNTTYNNEVALPETTADIPTDESKITKTFEPDVIVAAPFGPTGMLCSVVKLTDKYDSAVAALVSYDSEGNVLSVDTKRLDLSQTEIGGSVSINDLSYDRNKAQEIAAMDIIVFDNYTNLKPIAPIGRYSGIVAEAEESSMRVSADLGEYIGKKSIVLISDTEITEDITDEHIKYLYAEEITEKSYKSIPFADNAEGLYYIRVGIDGEQPIDETRSTVINIHPDNDGAKIEEYTENFDSYTFDASEWVLGTNCAKTSPNFTVETNSGDDKYLKLTQQNGSAAGQTNQTIGAYKLFDEADRIDVLSNPKQVITAQIMFGKPDGSGTWGNSQFAIGSSSVSKSTEYFSSKEPDYGAANGGGHILLMQYEGGTGKLTVNGEIIAESASSFADKWISVTANADFTKQVMDITVQIDGAEAQTFTNVPFYASANINDIGSMYMRAAKPNGAVCVNNVDIYRKTAPQYAITVTAVDGGGSAVSGAIVTVKDADGTVISPADDGTYMLTLGSYKISVTADGYTPVTDREFVLEESLLSKNVEIELE